MLSISPACFNNKRGWKAGRPPPLLEKTHTRAVALLGGDASCAALLALSARVRCTMTDLFLKSISRILYLLIQIEKVNLLNKSSSMLIWIEKVIGIVMLILEKTKIVELKI